jgi:DNA-binding PadR family transcriptional regulator
MTVRTKAPAATSALTLTEYAVLALLVHAKGAISGYDLRKLAASGVGYIWTPSKTQLYAVLGRLVERGLATRRDVAQRRRPDKQLYRATFAGRAAVRDWLARPEDETDPDKSTFILKLFFGAQGDRAALREQLRAFRDSYARRLDLYEHKARHRTPDGDDFTFLTLRYGIARARAAVEWADQALKELA